MKCFLFIFFFVHPSLSVRGGKGKTCIHNEETRNRHTNLLAAVYVCNAFWESYRYAVLQLLQENGASTRAREEKKNHKMLVH